MTIPPDSNDPLDPLFQEWRVPDPPPDMENRVWRRVGSADDAGRMARLGTWIFRPAAAVIWVVVGAAAVGVMGDWRLRQLERREELRMALDYGRLVDPAAGWPAAGTDAGARLERDLLWLRRELELSPEQFAQLRSLHESSNERLQLLAVELAQERQTEAHWEAERTNTGDVDFLSYGFAAKGVDALGRMSAQATRSLIESTAAVLDNRQRERYLGLVRPAGGAPGGIKP